MDRNPLTFGAIALAVGLASGYLIHAFPEGLSPEYPLWVALLAPAAFLLAGLHLIAVGLRFPRAARATVLAVALCLLAVANWAALFTTRVECRQSLSFLGVAILTRYPSEEACLAGLRLLMGGIDALVLLPAILFAWHGHRNRPAPPARPR